MSRRARPMLTAASADLASRAPPRWARTGAPRARARAAPTRTPRPPASRGRRAVQCNAAACFSGTYYTSAPVTMTLSANDGAGSGVQRIRYTTDGTDPSPVNGSDYVGALSISITTTVKFRAYDNLGNEEAVGSQEVLLDGTPPTMPLTLSENPASGAQHVSGTTLYYRPR